MVHDNKRQHSDMDASMAGLAMTSTPAGSILSSLCGPWAMWLIGVRVLPQAGDFVSVMSRSHCRQRGWAEVTH